MAVGVALSPIQESLVQVPGSFDNRVDLHSGESILIYLSVTGSAIPFRVMESDSIASVKLMIQTCKGFAVNKQKLVYGGRELARNDCLVKDYGVIGGHTLHLVLKLSDLLAITVSTTCGKEFEFQIDRYRNVGYLKQRIYKEGQGVVDVKDQELFCGSQKLEDRRLINDISKNNDSVIHLLIKKPAKVRATPVKKDVELSVVALNVTPKGAREFNIDKKCRDLQVASREPPDRDFWLEPAIVHPNIRLPLEIWDLISLTLDGLDRGYQPVRSTEGTGGAYFMPDPSGQKIVAVFKPSDEEPMAVNNPQGLPVSDNGEGLKKGTRVGEGALREVAAYLLDHPKNGPRSLSGGELMGFSGVPPTTMVRCLHKGFYHPKGYEGTTKNTKIGSLQMFRENNGNCEDIGPQAFPVEEVHKISVLDIRLANADRHAGNILFRKDTKNGQMELIPIDHGYCLPDSFEDCTFDWLYWPQARQGFSSETIDYIRSLDADQDLRLLKFHGWEVPLECARILRVSTMLLKKGAENGLTPFAIGKVMCRETINKESAIEEIVREAQDSLLPGMSEDEFLAAVSSIMDSRLAKLY